MTTDHLYRYLAPSAVTVRPGVVDLDLSTSSGPDVHPWLAEGFVRAAQPAARALLVVATVAGKRFWTPPNMVAAAIAASDPVVTTSPDGLRFESFSRCCGVYARFDLDAGGFHGTVHADGTTNVDVNAPLRSALARVGSKDPLLLRVGTDEVVATTLDAHVVEKRVPLPERWVRGFAEVAVATASLEPAFELRGAGLRRFLDGLPTVAGRAEVWVVASGPSARISTRPAADSVPGTGVERLRILRDLGPFLQSLTAFGPPGGVDGPSAWVASLDGGSATVTLSPTPSRGFSGEGGLLMALVHGGSAAATDGEAIERASMGRLGYDVASAEWFARELPFDRSVLQPTGGRLAHARALVDGGAVLVDATGTGADVITANGAYRVRKVGGGWRCTCPWWGKHGTDRGPCKHVLATVLAVAAS